MGEEGHEDLGDKGHLGKVRMEARFFAASHLLGPQACFVLTFFPQVFLPRCLILISVSFYFVETMFPVSCTV